LTYGIILGNHTTSETLQLQAKAEKASQTPRTKGSKGDATDKNRKQPDPKTTPTPKQNPISQQDPVRAQEIKDRFLKYRESFEKSEASEYPALMNEMLQYAFSKQEESPEYAEGIAVNLSLIITYSKNLYVQKIGRPLVADDIIKVLDTINNPNQSVLVMRDWGVDLYRGMIETERDKTFAYVEGYFDKEMPVIVLLKGVINTAESLVIYEKGVLKQDKAKANQTQEIVARTRKRDDEIQKRAIRIAKCIEKTLKRVQQQEKYDDSTISSWLGQMRMLGKYDPEVKKIAIRNLREGCMSTTNSFELRRSCASILLRDAPDDPDYNSVENRDFIKKLADSEPDETLLRAFQSSYERAEEDVKAKDVNPRPDLESPVSPSGAASPGNQS
jgi:hypothetical protein